MRSRDLLVFCLLSIAATSPATAEPPADASRLVAALMGATPLTEDLEQLTDAIGGRPTGSKANRQSVDWALERLRAAGVEARAEAFTMPELWLERSARATVSDGTSSFSPRVAAMPYSGKTSSQGIDAPLLDGGSGTEADFARLGKAGEGAFVLIATDALTDVPGLFKEYTDAAAIETRAFAAGVTGVVYMGSRPGNQLYRHNASLGVDNTRPMVVMERDGAARALRRLQNGTALRLLLQLDLETSGPYESHNVVGEIRGSEAPDEVVVIGAHLDSWGIGDGALDNGCNVALVIDLARQIHRLGLVPRRTIRFVLFNGEEQGMFGSLGYTRTHADELDHHVMASSYDIGSGRIVGFFTGGRPEIIAAVQQALEPVAGLGPFVQLDLPIVGTDNYDFMMQGIANLVANQDSANYGPNYHSRSDTFDKVDLEQLRLNAAIAAAVTWGFANQEIAWGRQGRGEVQAIIDSTDLGDQMRTFGLWKAWESGERGRSGP